MSVNKVILIGNVAADPEIKTISETKVASFRVATSEKYKDRNGETHENVDWHNIACWRNLAELCEKYVHKGDKIYIEGKLKNRQWEDKDGNKRSTTEVVAEKIEFCISKQSSQIGTQEPAGLGGADDIPFR